MGSGHTCSLHKWFLMAYFGSNEKNAVTLPHIAQMKHAFLGKIKEIPKIKKLSSRKKIDL